ncbi:cystathionine gamma-synthase [Microlunatus elymi]|uniref:Cystathionine gamma-synthase n=2 Tax=Microlunatus elymi TaxID=2596828 RepID=A0A516Q5Y8_9ACTN|nr:cystathionine gamma-synthase [Microlunatus elymi]
MPNQLPNDARGPSLHQYRPHPDTIAISAGRPERRPDAPLNQPIVPASTYVGGDGTEWVGYGRYGNPGWSALEDAVGALEGGTALAFASGMAAAAAVFSSIPPDAVVVIPEHCYLGVASLAHEHAQRHGLTVRTVDITDTERVLAAADGARLIWLESPANPTMEVADLAAIAAGRPDGCLLLVDNTFATPILQQPIGLGSDIVLHSATKFLSGHSDALCGMLIFADGREELLEAAESARKLHGATPGVLEAYLVLRGIRTLSVRVRHAESTARTLAETLAEHPLVERVRYPGFGSMLAIELPDASAADTMINSLRLWVHATSLGGVESSLERRRRWPSELKSVPEGLVRMSVGLEHVDDLIADLRQALDLIT